jgi:hypothetical protein
MNPKVKTTKGKGVGVRSLARSISRAEGHVGAPRWGLGWMTSRSIIHTSLHKPNNKLVILRNWNTFGARTRHEHTWTHKTHYDPNLGETSTFPLILFFMISHRGCIQMSFCPKTPKLGIPKFSKLWFPQLWKPITSYENLQLKWSLKQSCSLYLKFSNDMWHNTWTQVNQGDSWLLMVKNQIGTLTPGPFLGHNFCFKYSNGSCEPILKI